MSVFGNDPKVQIVIPKRPFVLPPTSILENVNFKVSSLTRVFLHESPNPCCTKCSYWPYGPFWFSSIWLRLEFFYQHLPFLKKIAKKHYNRYTRQSAKQAVKSIQRKLRRKKHSFSKRASKKHSKKLQKTRLLQKNTQKSTSKKKSPKVNQLKKRRFIKTTPKKKTSTVNWFRWSQS